jgi:hypothetical protein
MFGKRNDINEKYILKLFGYKFRKKKGIIAWILGKD